MYLNSGNYQDITSKTSYILNGDIDLDANKIYLLQGENGIGKSRFLEGVLLKELKDKNLKKLYFAQDIENQLLSFELISLVKEFIGNLKKQGSFFKTIFLNDDSHESIELDFNQDEVLEPSSKTINNFILKECEKYNNLDVVIFDEVDKYFSSSADFINFIVTLEVKSIFVISHILNSSKNTNNCIKCISFTKEAKGVRVELPVS